jgi:hypothetical protein
VTDLFDAEKYLEPTSDIVALMVLEHQAQMHNLITRASFEAKQAMHYQKVMNRVLERDEDFVSDTTMRRIHSAGDELLCYLLFVDEFKLTSPIVSSNQFAEQFSNLGPRDSQCRSLRDFDLDSRLFRYPCSFLIYSSTYDKMPPKVLDYVEERLFDVLTGKDDSPQFQHLQPEDRQAILEILLETKPCLKQRMENRKRL